MSSKQKVKKLEYHRNGISGEGFYVAIVQSDGRDMLVVRFPCDKAVGAVTCAAFDIDLLAQRNIQFGSNSFRGDHFHAVVDAAIAKNEKDPS